MQTKSPRFILLALITLLFVATSPAAAPLFRFGAVADCQYCKFTSAQRKYNQSPKKLAQCVEHFNKQDLAFVVHLGDFIDRDFESFDVVCPIFEQLKAPRYHVLGNHDFSVADDQKTKVPARLGLKSRYYGFKQKGWRFLVLDGNDVSLYAHPKASRQTQEAKAFYSKLKQGTPTWNGGIGGKQLAWIREQLEAATRAGERVMLFCHFPVHPPNIHNLWNAQAVASLLKEFPCVAAYVNGHNHAGNYGQQGQVHYLTLKGMVDTTETAYSIIEVHKDELQLVGHGRQKNQVLKLRPKVAAEEAKWVPLFNGKNLDGWTVKIRGHKAGENFKNTFHVEDGRMKVGYAGYQKFEDRFGHIFYKDPLSHYRLRVEYRFLGDQVPGGPGWAFRNSGIMLHCQDPQSMALDQKFPVSIEVQLLGGRAAGKRTTANLCTPGTNVVINKKLHTRHCLNSQSETYRGDRWVTVEVEVRGSQVIRHLINGKVVLQYDNPQLDPRDPDAKKLIKNKNLLLEKGYISLQSESHPVEFRKVEMLILER